MQLVFWMNIPSLSIADIKVTNTNKHTVKFSSAKNNFVGYVEFFSRRLIQEFLETFKELGRKGDRTWIIFQEDNRKFDRRQWVFFSEPSMTNSQSKCFSTAFTVSRESFKAAGISCSLLINRHHRSAPSPSITDSCKSMQTTFTLHLES